jgi:hypothetical protein
MDPFGSGQQPAKAFLNRDMNLSAPQKSRNPVISWRTVSLSRWTILVGVQWHLDSFLLFAVMWEISDWKDRLVLFWQYKDRANVCLEILATETEFGWQRVCVCVCVCVCVRVCVCVCARACMCVFVRATGWIFLIITCSVGSLWECVVTLTDLINLGQIGGHECMWESGGTNPLILKLGIRRMLEAILNPRPLYPRTEALGHPQPV